MIRRIASLLPLVLLGASPAPPPLPVESAVVLKRLPHDPSAYTEGLFIRDGFLYESTGEVGRSFISRIVLDTGKVVRRVAVPPPYFGEGIIAWGQQIISLTWQHHKGFRWTLDRFRQIGSFEYPGEGWALTSDGRQIIMSDGTAQLRFLDPVRLTETRRISVTINGGPLSQLNELEYVDGEILANVWQTDYIVRIDPVSGQVIGLIDLSALTRAVHPVNLNAVANGIAWDASHRRLFVTGKLWPILFEIAPPKAAAP